MQDGEAQDGGTQDGTEDGGEREQRDGPPERSAPLVPWSPARDEWVAQQAVEQERWRRQRDAEARERAAEAAAEQSEDAAVERAHAWSNDLRSSLAQFLDEHDDDRPGPGSRDGHGPTGGDAAGSGGAALLEPPPGWTAHPDSSPDDARGRASRLPGHAWGRGRWGRTGRGSQYARPALLLGAPGTGKSRSAAEQVRRHDGSVLVVSTKSDLVDWTYAERQERGPVHVLDPAGVTAGRYPVSGFDLLRHARDLDGAGALVHAMAGWRFGGNDDLDFWMPLGASINQAVAYACARHGRSVADWHRLLLEDDHHEIDSLLADAGSGVAQSLWQAYTEREERNRSSVLLTARQQVRVLDSPAAQQLLSRDDVDPTRLLPDGPDPDARPTTLYLTVPASRVEVFGSLVPLVVDLAMDAALARESVHGPALPSLLVVLDEVAALGLARLPRWVDLCRSAGVQLLVLAQSLSTLASAFGSTACEQVLGSSDLLVLGGGRCPRTAGLLGVVSRSHRGRRGGELARGFAVLRALPRKGLGTALLLTDASEGQLVRLPVVAAGVPTGRVAPARGGAQPE